jgi:hypothetical protein
MNRSGFGGFQKLSPASGKSTAVDSFGTLESALKSALGNIDVQIFTTAVPSSITTIISGSTTIVSRWDPIAAPIANCHLSQSTLSAMPAYDFNKPLGKYYGVRAASDDQLVAATASINSPDHTYIVYGVYTSYAPVDDDYIASNWVEPAAPSSTIYGAVRLGTFNAFSSNTRANYQSRLRTVALNLGFRAYVASGGDQAHNILPRSNFYRVIETRLLPNRTGSMGVYDADMNTINVSNLTSVFPAANATLLTSNKTYVTFSPSSYSASLAANRFSDADWDNSFSGSTGYTFRTTTLRFFSNCTDASIFTVIFIPAVITADQSRNVKNILDQAYGV